LLAGFVGLANEVLWTRFLGLVIRNTVYTYTVVLGVILTGIVVGSLLALPSAASRRPPVRAFGTLQILAGLYVVTLLFLPVGFWRGNLDRPAICFLLFLPPAALSGAAFPLAVRIATLRGAPLGLEVGRLGAANVAGGVLGSLAVG